MADVEELAQVIANYHHRECAHDQEPPSNIEMDMAQFLLDSEFMENFERASKAEVLRGQANEVRHTWSDTVSWHIATMLDQHAEMFEKAGEDGG